jgi:hypothetical protein
MNLSSSTLNSSARKARALYWSLLFAVVLAQVIPLWVVEYPPLVDYPNHLSRACILARYSTVQVFQSTYALAPTPPPNSASDLILTPLCRAMNPRVAGKLFLSFIVVLFAAGCHLLGRRIQGEATWLAPLCTFFIYNSLFLYGFVNFNLGLGAFCVTLGSWDILRRRSGPWGIVLTGILIFATFLTHLAAFACLAVAAAVVTLYDLAKGSIRWPSALLAGAPFLPPLAAYVILVRPQTDMQLTAWSTPVQKATHALCFLLSYYYRFDVTLALLLLGILAAVLLRGHIEFHRPYLLAGCALWCLFLIAPFYYHSGADVDTRFVIPALLCTLLSVRIEIPRPLGALLLAGALAVFVVRQAEIAGAWWPASRLIAAQVALFRNLPEQSTVQPIVFPPDGLQEAKAERHMLHVLSYAVVDRNVLQPNTFAIPGQHTITLKRPFPGRFRNQGPQPSQVAWDAMFREYDYVWCFRAPTEYLARLQEGSDLIASAGEGRLYRIRKRVQ